MAQGDLLPSVYAYTEGAAVYVDGATGNDTTGNGTSGNPYATMQKAQDIIRATLSWPGSNDVIVYLAAGTYQASSAAQETLLVNYNTAGKRPSSTQRVVWKPWAGSEGAVIVQNPTGTGTSKYAVHMQASSSTNTANYTIFDGLEFYGGDTPRGNNTSGSSLACYVDDTSGFANLIEFRDCDIHGFQASGASAGADGFFIASGGDDFRIIDCAIHDIGTTAGTLNNQEHGFYCSASTPWIHNTLIYNIVNGYAIQGFSGDAAASIMVTQCTLANNYASGLLLDDSLSNVVISNTIIANHTGRGSSSYGIEIYPVGTPGTGNLVGNVVYYNNQGGNRSSSPTGWTFSPEQTADPLFVNVGSRDYHLAWGSPAVGYTNSSYASAADLEGVSRPAGSEDAGAYESVATEPVPPKLRVAQSNLRWR